ncbi:S41 family peptidase [Aurantiacibacter sp. D1-12]|uniref:S41 family peptidase n=1 Tax=Aurantiacibacter sp. D1-12 TaxID=2993658 RepID=UPI00237CD8A6|nr:S41 family peptidase [Aurantiacibacter sp. D1-12]MDE1467691.1 S41 family peptidase [Aurantiacibacter sp. D1-12]
MRTSKIALSLACIGMLVSCGGGGGGGTPTPTAGTGGGGNTADCSIGGRLTFTESVFNEWYLFPNLLDTSLNRNSFNNVQDYIDALVAPARAQNRDRFFSFVTSIAEETAFANSGSTAGFGIRLTYDTVNRRVFVIESYDRSPAVNANIERGTEIVGVGTTSGNIQSTDSLLASGGPQAFIDALGPSNPGVTRVLDIIDSNGTRRQVSVTKADYDLDPVPRYGAQIINDGGKQVGYIRLTNFINPAIADLQAAFADFRAAGVTEVVIDLRYNGGGRINVLEEFADLLGRGNEGNVFETIAFRASKSENNSTYRFQTDNRAIAPTRIAFITTGGSASASEALINGMVPYLGTNMAMVGTNTFGKPVGQSAFDLAACDDRLRVVTLQLENADGNGAYFNGLADTVPVTCRASDDIFNNFGDPNETMLAQALDFLDGQSCTAIADSGPGPRTNAIEAPQEPPELLTPERPRTFIEYEMPGLY